MAKETIDNDAQEQIVSLILECIQKAENRDLQRLLNEKDASELLGVAQGTLAIWRHHGKGPSYVKVGTSIRYKYLDLLQYIEEATIKINK